MIRNLLFFLILNLPVYAIDPPPFVTGTILGGLGNQMFQVATTSALAWDNQAQPYFPDFESTSNYPDGTYTHFFFRFEIFPPIREISYVFEAPPFGYYPIPFQSGMKIAGYFQNEKYFAHHRERLIALFKPHPDDLKAIETRYQWLIGNPNTVSVHLRYYHAEKPDDDTFIQYDSQYFEKAMALFPETSIFVVTSDNSTFARRTISTAARNVVFIENEPFYIDFHIQRLCAHNIISNSTFSWWSAWLNPNPNKIVVRPKKWLNNYPDIGGPSNWIKIDANGVEKK